MVWLTLEMKKIKKEKMYGLVDFKNEENEESKMYGLADVKNEENVDI